MADRRLAVSRPLGFLVTLPLLAALAACSSTQVAHSVAPRGEAEAIARALDLAPGDVVADVGAGKGEWTEDLARRVGPGGKVYANEVDEADLATLRRRIADHDLDNVEVVVGSATSTGLPESCCDAILLRRVYHHFTDPRAMGRSLLRALEPGGRLLAVEFPPDDPEWESPPGVPERGGHGIEEDELVRDLESLGFEVVERLGDWGGETKDYAVLVRRPSD